MPRSYVLKATRWKSDSGTNSLSRLVLLEWRYENEVKEYSRHWENVYSGESPDYFFGHYYMTFERALEDYNRTKESERLQDV